MWHCYSIVIYSSLLIHTSTVYVHTGTITYSASALNNTGIIENYLFHPLQGYTTMNNIVLLAAALVLSSQILQATTEGTASQSQRSNNHQSDEIQTVDDDDDKSTKLTQEDLETLARFLPDKDGLKELYKDHNDLDEVIKENLECSEGIFDRDPDLEVSAQNLEYHRQAKEILPLLRKIAAGFPEGEEKERQKDVLERLERSVAEQDRIVERQRAREERAKRNEVAFLTVYYYYLLYHCSFYFSFDLGTLILGLGFIIVRYLMVRLRLELPFSGRDFSKHDINS